MSLYPKRSTLNAVAGFSLIELMISIAILVVIFGVGFLLANPAGMFAKARNTQRKAHLDVIVNAIRENIADQRTGIFSCANGAIPTTSTKRMASGAGNYDIAPCLVPSYINALPFDPATTSARYVSMTDYDTGYFVIRSATSGEVAVSAPAAELGQVISVTR